MPPMERLSKKQMPLGKPEDRKTWTRLYGEERGSTIAKRKAPQDDQKQIDPTSEAWRALPWRKLEQQTYRIQKRIYRARQHGKQRTVQKLEKLLMRVRSGSTDRSTTSDPGEPG